MFETWKLHDFASGAGITAGAHHDTYDDADWLDVAVPGDVHTTLIAAGRIPDPFYDRNEPECAWMEEREWWYRLSFPGPETPPQPGERLQLVFHGLDTFTTVWLNGQELGQTRNMFREHVFDVTQRLRYGATNTLAVCFDPPLQHVDEKALSELNNWGHNPERVFMRKAQFGYGWDWGPRLPTIGIWRPVELRRQQNAALAGVHFYTLAINPAEDHALVAVRIEADPFATDRPLDAEITLTAPNGAETITRRVTLDDHPTATAYLEVAHPALWWTHDLGDPALYTLRVSLTQDGTALDTWQQRVGIRTLKLDQSPDTDEPGTRFFRFVLNGVPVFARGADWIPDLSFVGAIPDERYATRLIQARDANMTMLRIWGGGLYEHDVFYRLCDELGILIWQDFMFACAMYPEHGPVFVAEVEAEAKYQVARLRSHPCLALWCGNNENQWIHSNVFWDQPDYAVPGALYYHHILPEVVTALDGQTPYWPGSPYGGSDYASMEDGNRHNWDVWHGNHPRRFGEKPKFLNTPEAVSYVRYAEDTGRFISEFGMHAAPVYETLRRVIPADQLYHHSPSMDHHNKDNPKNKGDNLMIATTGLPDTLEDYIDLSMIAQAEGLKFGIEHFRRRKPHCSGTLIWQLNDCWPVLSWSLVDYYGFGKASYYYVRRVYAPVLASFRQTPDGAVELWITNDRLQPLDDTVTVRLGRFAGEPIWEKSLAVSVPANTSQIVMRWEPGEITLAADAYLSVRSASDLFPRNLHFFVMPKDVQREPVQPEATIETLDDHRLRVTLTAPAFAYFVHLIIPHETTVFSDNYFDLEPGETRTIEVTNPDIRLTPDMVTIRAR
jgi:beta-mannosidase